MNGFTSVPQPIPYQGSKRQIAPSILRYFPNKLTRVVEPFSGSAAISIASAIRHQAAHFWINDANAPLIELWRRIIFHPADLAKNYSRLWHDQSGRERGYFDEVRRRFNVDQDPADLLYLLARCVKASVRYNSNGHFNNTPDNRRKGARPSEMERRILTVSRLLRDRVSLTSWDYKRVLSECRLDDLVYMDPPYQGVCGRRDQRYLPKVDHEEFCIELLGLIERRIRFIVSYDGRTGDKVYGKLLPDSLDLTHLEISAGRSAQSTLLGRSDFTVESLYLSPHLSAEVLREPSLATGPLFAA